MPFPWDFLDIVDPDPVALKQRYRLEFIDRYVRDRDGNARDIRDWRAIECRFSDDVFDHAFTASDDYVLGLPHNEELSVERARRLPWIGEALRGDVPMYIRHRMHEVRRPTGKRRKRRVVRRVILVPDERYLVSMTVNQNGTMEFVTAFHADGGGWQKAMTEGAEVERRNNPTQ